MSQKKQQDILSVNTALKTIPLGIVYAFSESLVFIIDTILAGHFLKEEAVAAITIALPVLVIMGSFTLMIIQGGYLKMLERMGKSDMDGYDRVYSLMIFLSIVVDLIFMGICFFVPDAVISLTGGANATAEVCALSRLYLRTSCLMLFFYIIGTAFQLVILTNGYLPYLLLGIGTNIGVNLVISVLAMAVLPEQYKIAGLGIGSAAGSIAMTFVCFMIIKLRRFRVHFRIYPPTKENVLDALDCIRMGVPSSIDLILDNVSFSIVNNIILLTFANGTNVLAMVAIIYTIFSFVKNVGSGCLYASQPLFGIMNGERDPQGIQNVFTMTLKRGILLGLIFSAAIIILQQPILSFYGMAENTDARIGLVLVALSACIWVIPYLLLAVYQSTGHILLALVVAVIPDSILYPLFVAMSGKTIGVTGIWLAMGFSFIPFFIIFYLVFMLLNKKPVVSLDRLLLLKRYENRDTVLNISIPAEAQDICFVSERLQKFLIDHTVPEKIAYISALCTEEIAADYISYRKSSGLSKEKVYMDIKAFSDPEKIEIMLKNYDRPYNPLIIEEQGNEEERFSKIGVVMAQKIANKILYNYSYHLNVITMTFML